MLGISQQELSKLSGISQQIISRLESKKAEGTTSIVGLANALKVTPEWLQFGKESMARVEQPIQMIASNDDERVAQDGDEAMLLRIFREMTDEQQADIIKNATDTHKTNERLLTQLLARKKA